MAGLAGEGRRPPPEKDDGPIPAAATHASESYLAGCPIDASMGERLSKFLPLFVGIVIPLLLIGTNMVWNYAGILLTILAIMWLGFAIVFLSPSAAST